MSITKTIKKYWIFVILIIAVVCLIVNNSYNMIEEFSDTSSNVQTVSITPSSSVNIVCTTSTNPSTENNADVIVSPQGPIINFDDPCIRKIYSVEDMDKLDGRNIKLMAVSYELDNLGHVKLDQNDKEIIKSIKYLSKSQICPEKFPERECNTFAVLNQDKDSPSSNFKLLKTKYLSEDVPQTYKLQSKSVINGIDIYNNLSQNLNVIHIDRPLMCIDGANDTPSQITNFVIEPVGDGSIILKYTKTIPSVTEEDEPVKLNAYVTECNSASYSCTVGSKNFKRVCLSRNINPYVINFYVVLADNCNDTTIEYEVDPEDPEGEEPLSDVLDLTGLTIEQFGSYSAMPSSKKGEYLITANNDFIQL
jgi:hypothetical protein